MLNKIKNELKKDNLKGVTFNPTLEECDYLYKYNIISTKSVSRRTCLLLDYSYLVDVIDFCIE